MIFNQKREKTNIDSIIGKQAIVVNQIDNLKEEGQVILNGMEWSARSTSGEPIGENVKVRIDRVEGVKLFVTPVEVTVESK